MGLFNKNKKENKKETPCQKARPENENRVYFDGAFEVFENTDDGKKYGRIINYHDTEKIIEITDEEFELWRDASENFSKYRITFERDEEFFIEKVNISLAEEKIQNPTAEKVDNEPAIPAMSDEDRSELSSLIGFYNDAIKNPDIEKSTSLSANLAQSIATAALCERKINELITKAKKETPTGEKVTVQIPKALDNLCQNAKKSLFNNISVAKTLYVLYSEHTKRPHSAGGNALVALTREVADNLVADFSKKGQKVYVQEFATTSDISSPPAASRIVSESANLGLRGIRFIYKFGFSTMIQLNTDELIKKINFPENILLRATMSGFFQDMRNGVPSEKLKTAELAMYDALFRSTLLQPCMKRKQASKDELSVSIVKDENGNCLLELFTSLELLERSESYIRFKSESFETSGYKKWSFDALLTEIMSQKTSVSGFIIDKECVPVPFHGAILDKIVKLKAIWDNNGKSFANNKNQE